jgi:hypothetical protein
LTVTWPRVHDEVGSKRSVEQQTAEREASLER